MRFNILIVDDEKNIREGLAGAVEIDGYRAYVANNGREALRILEMVEVDLVISDLRMPVMDGERLLKWLAASKPGIPAVILTGHGTVESAVRAMHSGAYDFLTKPVNLNHLSLVIKRALANRELARQYRELRLEVTKRHGTSNIVARSGAMIKLREVVAQVAPTRVAVLITGESGVGKELIVDALHRLSNRHDQPLIKVNCAALSPTLLESELFGHEKGAFTGAAGRKRGRFELADRGTIFLDEIGEIDQIAQVKILRVLQEKQFERVGGEETLEVDTRIISATNRNLHEAVATGKFREDLFYRLNALNLHVPPLRERKEDILPMAAAFIEEFSRENNKKIEGISPDALALLNGHDWPGNARELRNTIESAVALSRGKLIERGDLSGAILRRRNKESVQLMAGITLEDAEKKLIKLTLRENGGNRGKSSEMLGIDRKTLRRKIERYGITP